MPWSLMDELEAEKARWEMEKSKLHPPTRDRLMERLPWYPKKQPHKARSQPLPTDGALVSPQSTTDFLVHPGGEGVKEEAQEEQSSLPQSSTSLSGE